MPLRNWAGEVVGQTVLPGAVFDVDVRRDILHRVVRWQLAKRQQVVSTVGQHRLSPCSQSCFCATSCTGSWSC